MNKNVILCVDDERIILDSLVEQLERNFGNRYIYECAENIADAQEIIEEYYEDSAIVIIITDWLMPGIKGDEFLIKINEHYPKTIKIMLTGHADKTAIDKAIEYANLTCYLYKPWKECELIEAINKSIEFVE